MPAVPVLQAGSLLSTVDAANLAGVSVAAIRKWVQRGTLEVAARDWRDRPLFEWRAVAIAERATRDKASTLGKTRVPFAA